MESLTNRMDHAKDRLSELKNKVEELAHIVNFSLTFKMCEWNIQDLWVPWKKQTLEL